MKKLLLILALVCTVSASALNKLQGYAERGGQQVATAGFISTTKVQKSYPGATVSVYLANTNTLATIYSDASFTAKSNPFTASADGSWLFYGANGCYDIRFSGTGIDVPWTVAGLCNSSSGSSVAACPSTPSDAQPCIQALIDAAASDSVVQLPVVTGGYRLNSPLIIKKSRITLSGTGQFSPLLTFDLTSYVGPHLKYGIIIGDDTIDPSAGITYQGNSIRDLNVYVQGATGGILVQRGTLTSIDRTSVNSVDTLASYGIRVIASDSMVNIERCSVGGSSSVLTPTVPTVGISLENGTAQARLTGNIFLAKVTPVQIFNSEGIWITQNTIGAYTSSASPFYGVKLATDQPVPVWLTWIPAASNIHILNNWFEPADFVGATVYDIYVGSGTPSVHSIVGVVVDNNFFFGTTSATRYPIYVDYGEQTVISGATWFGSIQDLVHITSHALHTAVNIPDLSAYNQTPISGFLVNNLGSKSQLLGRFTTPVYASGTYTALGGGNTWTVQSGDVVNLQYSMYGKKMLVIAYLANTDVAGAPTQLQIAIPDGYVAAKFTRTIARVIDAGAIAPDSTVTTVPGDTNLWINRSDGAAFTATTGGTSVQFQIEFEVQ